MGEYNGFEGIEITLVWEGDWIGKRHYLYYTEKGDEAYWLLVIEHLVSKGY